MVFAPADHGHLHVLVFLVAVGVGLQWLAARLKFPVILLLLAAGIVAGPVSGLALDHPLLVPEELFGDLLGPFVHLAVAVVLFEGGLTLNLKEARHVGKTLARLLISGLIVGFALTTLSANFIGGLSFVMITTSEYRLAARPIFGRFPRSLSPPQPKTVIIRRFPVPPSTFGASSRSVRSTFSSASSVCA